ncbi:MAG: methylated-DNA--[protein]-cysteine S-methyltransferase [Nitriliruptorales bacterium]
MHSLTTSPVEPATSAGEIRAPLPRDTALAYRTLDSPLGPLLLAVSERGLVRLALPAEVIEQLPASVARGRVDVRRRLDEASREIDEYFRGLRRDFALAIDWRTTVGFTRRVLEAATRIPYGEVTSYSKLAAAAGNPRAARATGRALACNPVPIVVPCHRVVPAAGGIGGYAGGPELKVRLLKLEGAV